MELNKRYKKFFKNKEEFNEYLREINPRQIWKDSFSKEYPFIIITNYLGEKFLGVYNKQGIGISGDKGDFSWLYEEGLYVLEKVKIQ